MSFSGSTAGSGSRTSQTSFEFGRTHVVWPKGKHEATIVWLHGLGDKGSSYQKPMMRRLSKYAATPMSDPPKTHYFWRIRHAPIDYFEESEQHSQKLLLILLSYMLCSWSQLFESLPLPNVKWICPTAPTRPVAAFGGFPCTAWFDVGDISEDAPDDLEGLDFSAAHVANLLSTEPADVKLCVGGFSMGAAAALYSATCHAFKQYGNGSPYPLNLSAVVGLSGWLPCSRTLRNRMQGMNDAGRRAASLPILLCHGTGDDVVAYQHGEKSARILSSSGFQNLTFRNYQGLGHYTIPEETDEVCCWLAANLRLGGT